MLPQKKHRSRQLPGLVNEMEGSRDLKGETPANNLPAGSSGVGPGRRLLGPGASPASIVEPDASREACPEIPGDAGVIEVERTVKAPLFEGGAKGLGGDIRLREPLEQLQCGPVVRVGLVDRGTRIVKALHRDLDVGVVPESQCQGGIDLEWTARRFRLQREGLLDGTTDLQDQDQRATLARLMAWALDR